MLRHQREDSVAKWKARSSRFRPANKNQAAEIDSPVSRGRGRRRCIPKAYVAAARRLPLCPAARDPASDALVPAPVSAHATGSPGCPKSKAKPPPNANSRPIRSATFISTSPRFELRKASFYLLVAIDRTSKFAFVEMHEKVARRTAEGFLRRLIAPIPYKVHTVLTENGTRFATPGNTSSAAPDIKAALEAEELVWAHAFEYTLRRERHRSPAYKAQASMDQWASRKNEPHYQGRERVKRYFSTRPTTSCASTCATPR